MVDRKAILKEIEELTSKPVVDREKDFTVDQLCDEFKLSKSGIGHRMRQLVASGKFGTAVKFDPTLKRQVRVWWKICLIDKNPVV